MQRGVLVVSGKPRRLNVARCTNFIERARGLLGHPELRASDALWISPCAGIHTFGMRYSIDVVFCDFDGTVIRIVEHLEPGRIIVASGARTACELRAGMARASAIAENDRLSFSPKLQI